MRRSRHSRGRSIQRIATDNDKELSAKGRLSGNYAIFGELNAKEVIRASAVETDDKAQ